jgi:hypothetical protein
MMKKYFLFTKSLAVSIIFLLVGLTFIPQTALAQPLGKSIITVDDEPGDADYTSIKEAVQHAANGDTIDVYSGTYREHDINIVKEGLSLLGIPHELGSGNDTGTPVLTSSNNVTIVTIWGNDVTLTGFTIIDGSPPNLATMPIHIWGDNCMFLDNNVTGGWNTLVVGQQGSSPAISPRNTYIIGNNIKGSTMGMDYTGTNGYISYNSFLNCSYKALGVFNPATATVIEFNSIDNCGTGIMYDNGSDSIIYHNVLTAGIGIDLEVVNANNITIIRNELKGCRIGIKLVFKQSLIFVRQNNVVNNSGDAKFAQYLPLKYTIGPNRVFDGNYYDTWKSGPNRVWGKAIIYEIPLFWGGEFFFVIPISVPWVYHDWDPAREPYDIIVI